MASRADAATLRRSETLNETTQDERARAKAPRDHPSRAELAGEVHARPFASLQAPLRASHLALLSGETGADAERRHVAALCARFEAEAPAEGATHFLADLGPLRLKWERHTEFSTYTLFRQGPAEPGEDLFARPALEHLPQDWLDGLPGELMVGMHLVFLAQDPDGSTSEDLPPTPDGDALAGGRMAGGAGTAWVDFRFKDDGFGRVLIYDRGLKPRQAGRLVQRLLEIETYRMMALLALPQARRTGPELSEADYALMDITRRLAEIDALEEQRRLLDELTGVSAAIERISAATDYRFGASRAYYALVQRRIAELREERIEGFQTSGEVMERRMAPAMRTCESVARRIDALSGRLTRASHLLRARIEIQLEAQNRDLLASMDRRARLQMRLQETVEGLSVAAISYYLASLIGYLAKGLKVGGVAVNPDLATALSIPVIAVLVWLAVRRVRRRVARASDSEERPESSD
jgi:uncharacterized membrane-anchored protein